MRASLKARMTKLENKRSNQGANRVLILPARSDDLFETSCKVHPMGKYMIVNNIGSDDEWETAVIKQQQKLLSK